MTVVDHPDFGVEAEIARQVSVQGVPLLNGSAAVNTQARTALASGSSSDLGPFILPQPGYELFVSCDSTDVAAGTFQVKLEWFDSGFSTLIPIAVENWWVWPGTAAQPHQFIIRGPTKGDSLIVHVGYSFGVSVNYSFTLLNNSRIYTRDDGRTVTSVGLVSNGLTSGVYDLEANTLVSTAPANVAAGTGVSRLMPLYSGAVNICFRTASGIGDMECAITTNADQSNSWTNINAFNNYTNANGEATFSAFLPRVQCLLVLTNHNAAAKTLSCMITVAEQVT
jgi:hypothetical protein